MTLIVCLFIIFLNNGTFLNLPQQCNVAVVDGLEISALNCYDNKAEKNSTLKYNLSDSIPYNIIRM